MTIIGVQNQITKQRNNKYCLESLTCKKALQFDFFYTLESSKVLTLEELLKVIW